MFLFIAFPVRKKQLLTHVVPRNWKVMSKTTWPCKISMPLRMHFFVPEHWDNVLIRQRWQNWHLHGQCFGTSLEIVWHKFCHLCCILWEQTVQWVSAFVPVACLSSGSKFNLYSFWFLSQPFPLGNRSFAYCNCIQS